MRTTGQSAARDAHAMAERAMTSAAHGDWRSTIARFGLIAKGILYAALGVLAINVATGDAASQAASKRGAIELVASQPFGQWLLIILTTGLFALAAWQLILAFKGDPVEGSEGKDRAKYAGKAIIYLGTAITALSVLLANWGTGSSGGIAGVGAGGTGTEQQATAVVMNWPGGPWIVAVVGLAVIAMGIYQMRAHAMHKKFMERLDRGSMSPHVETGVERAGRLGYLARGIVFASIGTFFIVAAVQHDPQEAVGLSGALQALAVRTGGQVVLWVVAVGLLLYGIFCVAEAKYRRAT